MLNVSGSILAFLMMFFAPAVSMGDDLFDDFPISIAPDETWEWYIADASDTIQEKVQFRLYDGGRDEQNLEVQEILPDAEKQISRRLLERQYFREMEREPSSLGGKNRDVL